MKFEAQNIPGVRIIVRDSYTDERGSLTRHFCRHEFAEHHIPQDIAQSNLSKNKRKFTLRGFHYQKHPHGEGKTISVFRGAIHNIVVDLRSQSPTYLKWLAFELSDENSRSLYVPPGCANAFLTLKDDTWVFYYHSQFYAVGSQAGIRYNDPVFGFKWPREPKVISEKDKNFPNFIPEKKHSKKTRVLLTGGTGFIGSHLVQALVGDPDIELALLVREIMPETESLKDRVTLIHGDLEIPGSFRDAVVSFAPEACVHLAWEGIPDFSKAMSQKNLEQSKRFFEVLFKDTDCKKFIASGSCAEYGSPQGACKETDAHRGKSDFAEAKTRLCNYLSKKCLAADKEWVWFRLFYVFGPGQREDSLIPTLVQAFQTGTTPEVKEPGNRNDYIYVGDVAAAFQAALKTPSTSGIYNLGTGKHMSVEEICRMVEKEICGHTSFSDSLHSPAGRSPVSFWADEIKTRRALGWIPKVSVEAGIAKTVECGFRAMSS